MYRNDKGTPPERMGRKAQEPSLVGGVYLQVRQSAAESKPKRKAYS